MRIDGLTGFMGLLVALGVAYVFYQMGKNQVFG